jgi:hypothetical protein
VPLEATTHSIYRRENLIKRISPASKASPKNNFSCLNTFSISYTVSSFVSFHVVPIPNLRLPRFISTENGLAGSRRVSEW